MLVLIGWVLWLAPFGVFGLAFAVGAGAGGAAFGAVLIMSCWSRLIGMLVMLAGYGIAWARGGLVARRISPGR